MAELELSSMSTVANDPTVAIICLCTRNIASMATAEVKPDQITNSVGPGNPENIKVSEYHKVAEDN